MATTTMADQPLPEKEEEEGVEAKLQYLADHSSSPTTTTTTTTTPAYHASEAGTQDVAKHDGEYSSHTVTVLNGRHDISFLESLNLDRQGFRLVSHISTVQDFFKEEELLSTYNLEIEELLLREIPRAKRVIIFDHTRRSSSSSQRQALNCREPSATIHNDYTEWSAKKRLYDILGDVEAETIVQGRFAIVNVWRPITDDGNDTGVVESWPMTLCDSTTVQDERDLVSVKRIAKDRIGELQMARFHPNHRWYYFPHMKLFQEVLLFKTYDSISDGTTNRFTIHTAFDDPTSSKDARPRQSIETRVFVIF